MRAIRFETDRITALHGKFLVIRSHGQLPFKYGDKFFRKPKEKQRGDEKVHSFFAGLWLQFLNPKMILYGITAISTFIMPFFQSNISLILFSLFLAFVGFLATSCWALFGALFQKFLSKYRKPFDVVMELLLIYSTVSIFV